ncbi:GNAT family N-acetyltransferase [Nocardioides yefusunii]|uniref:GNAT family N-acetyltransferase n=1 Tax=Nocardioides yefusunii TaxID=2500546 RepID=A0ABW1QY06_9ACTN|nr:GNAT family N-acetyltransferase [Nocardioides yefusunii]
MTPTEPGPAGASLTPDDVLLRPAGEDDVVRMAALQVQARRAAPMPGVVDPEVLAADLRAGLGDDEFWIAERDGEAVGYVRFVRPDATRVGWLDDLYVDPNASGQGVGTLLLEFVQASLPGGFGLWAFAENAPARAFYRASGLREREFVPAADSPTGEDEVRMTWP